VLSKRQEIDFISWLCGYSCLMYIFFMLNSRETRPVAFRAIFYALIFPFFAALGSTDSGGASVTKDTSLGRRPALFTKSDAAPTDTSARLSGGGPALGPSDSIQPAKDTLNAKAFTPESAAVPLFAREVGLIGKKDSLKPLFAIPQNKGPQRPSSSGPNDRKSVSTARQNAEKFLVRLLIIFLFISVFACFVAYVKNRSERRAFVTKTRLSIMDKEVQKACNYIEKNYRNSGLSVETICKDLVTGKAFLEALFKQDLGIEVVAFITHVRINRARILLESKPGTDADVAATATGFLTTESFRSAFSGIVGVSFENYKNLRTTDAC
jgi:AraC-like DNA-binding protein